MLAYTLAHAQQGREMRFVTKDYRALVGTDPTVAEVGAAPSSVAVDDSEMMAVLMYTTPGYPAILLSPSCSSSSSVWDKTGPAVL